MKYLFSTLCLLAVYLAQGQDCNKFGAWMWHFELTEFQGHVELADSLVNMGVKRIYVKVADGGIDPEAWPEIEDVFLVNVYKTRGMEVFAWSYNYPGNLINQAEALVKAVETGYDGYVVDVEMEFDGDAQALNGLFGAFAQKRNDMEVEGVIPEDFKLYCTTWGNPKDHDFYLSIIDPYVDGYLAQTYVEQWGPSYVENLEFWIEEGNKEYKEMGATKPVHHIIAMQDGLVSAERANAFFQHAGPETSIWRIPGGGIDLSVWNVWNQVEWDYDYCDITNTSDLLTTDSMSISPNPAMSEFRIVAYSEDVIKSVKLFDGVGRLVRDIDRENLDSIDISSLPTGFYIVKIVRGKEIKSKILIKN